MIVNRELQCQGVADIPERHTMASIYETFLNLGTAENFSPSVITTTTTEHLLNSMKNVSREKGISKNQAHIIVRNLIGFKPDIMHSIQQTFYFLMNLLSMFLNFSTSIIVAFGQEVTRFVQSKPLYIL